MAVEVLADRDRLRGEVGQDGSFRHYVDTLVNLSWFAESPEANDRLQKDRWKSRSEMDL